MFPLGTGDIGMRYKMQKPSTLFFETITWWIFLILSNVAILYAFQYAINNVDYLFSIDQIKNARMEIWKTIGLLGYLLLQNAILYKAYMHFQSKRIQVHAPTIIGLLDDFGTACSFGTACEDPIQRKTEQTLIRYSILFLMILDMVNYILLPVAVAIITIDTAIVHNIIPMCSIQIIIAWNIILIDQIKFHIGLDTQSVKTAYNIAKNKGGMQ